MNTAAMLATSPDTLSVVSSMPPPDDTDVKQETAVVDIHTEEAQSEAPIRNVGEGSVRRKLMPATVKVLPPLVAAFSGARWLVTGAADQRNVTYGS